MITTKSAVKNEHAYDSGLLTNQYSEVLSCGSFGPEKGKALGSQALRERKLKYKSKVPQLIEDSQNFAAV